jgi:hypothetical protein
MSETAGVSALPHASSWYGAYEVPRIPINRFLETFIFYEHPNKGQVSIHKLFNKIGFVSKPGVYYR